MTLKGGAEMPYSYKIDGIINNVLEICNDCDTFEYHRRFGYKVRIDEKLGSGRVLQAIGLFSALSFLAKIHTILQYGHKMKDYSNEYNEFVIVLKEKGISNTKIDRYVKPKNKIEINETEAFVKLINDYPDKFGLEELDNKELRQLWNEYRNHLIHTLFVGNESMIIESIVSNLAHPFLKQFPDVNNFQDERYKKTGQNHSFTFIPNKEDLRGKLISNYVEADEPIDWELVMRASHDEIKIDNLNIDVRNISNWILDKFNNEEYKVEYVKQLEEWLYETGVFRKYTALLPQGIDLSKYKYAKTKK